MTRVWWLLACVPGVWAATEGRAASAARQAASVRWLGDYQEARRVARETGKPIFVVFRCEH